ncbi:hypothetical protein ELH77_19345 [Rhizobium ruizarguesonis]|uniref:hypothetical protein n=1 Tax=Rhizobium ruizarguesonis TaxID=2081791 RepID=UPI0010307C6A|nr:hypothetical protein [Rhizobium ruizarguesonis]TAZ20762.1 hypothetical protein ELH77_19345 [Rhizobium ruizarguesonis]
MAIDITNPGGSEAQLQAALRGLVGGWVPLESGIISSPQQFIDVDLPEGFIAYRLSCVGLTMDGLSFPSYVLSDDGGDTYLIDNDEATAYTYYEEYHDGGSAAPFTDLTTFGRGRLASFFVAEGDRFAATLDIDPGAAGKWAVIASHLWVANSALQWARCQSFPESTTGRMDAMRLGSADAFNTSPVNRQFASGAYSLLGIPAA